MGFRAQEALDGPRTDSPRTETATRDVDEPRRQGQNHEIGDLLGERYQLVAELGRGGEAVVFRALDLRAETEVALKLIDGSRAGVERLARLRGELKNARRITHPNVVRLYDLVELPSAVGLSMELVHGETLKSLVAREGPLPRASLERLCRELAGSLAAAHAAGVVHRDLKPSNVLMRSADGMAVVSDFGVSRLFYNEDGHEGAPPRAELGLVGTPAYMAPEQLAGERAGPAADVYAFGLLIFYAATGALPDAGSDRRLTQPLFRGVRPDVPAALARIVDRCLAPSPRDRYEHGGALEAAVARALEPRSPSVAALLAMGVVAATAIALLVRARPTPTPAVASVAPSVSLSTPHPTVRNVRRITFDAGCESYPSFLPDGRSLVFDSDAFRDPDDGSELVRIDLATGAQRRLTRTAGSDFGSAVSPDGRWLAYLHDDDARELRFLDLGGDAGTANVPPMRDVTAISWTRAGELFDGRRDGTVVRRSKDLVGGTVVARLATGLVPAGLAVTDSARVFALVRRQYEPPILAELRGGAEMTVLDDRVFATEADIGLGATGTLLYYGRRSAAGALELVARPIGSGEPTVLPTGIAPRGGFSISKGGAALAWSTCNGSSTLTRVRDGKPMQQAPPTSWDDLFPRRLDAGRTLVTSNRGGPFQIWSVDFASGGANALTGANAKWAAASPNGDRIVYLQLGVGLRVKRLSDGVEVALTTDPTDDLPVFDASGAHVVFQRRGADGSRVLTVPAHGGEPRVLASSGASWPAASPTEASIVYVRAGAGGSTLRRVRLDGTGDEAVPGLAAGKYRNPRFSSDAKSLLFVTGSSVSELTLSPRGGGQTPKVTIRATVEANRYITSVEYAPDGDGLLLASYTYSGDIWLAEGYFP